MIFSLILSAALLFTPPDYCRIFPQLDGQPASLATPQVGQTYQLDYVLYHQAGGNYWYFFSTEDLQSGAVTYASGQMAGQTETVAGPALTFTEGRRSYTIVAGLLILRGREIVVSCVRRVQINAGLYRLGLWGVWRG